MKQVLITNNTLDGFAGTECYVLEVAANLLKRGWQPIAFSTRLGKVAEALRAVSVPVVDQLQTLQRAPDLIHAHHHLDAIIAIQTFPGVPVIYFCHGWYPWQEAPLLHPQITHYVAVDALCRERLVIEAGVPEEKVTTLLNFVDLARYRPRAPLPAKPKRALIFSNALSVKHPTTQAIVQACENLGIVLDHVGSGANQALSHPETALQHYDLVFAKARCAMEALATGCAVITCDAMGLAGLVTPQNFQEFRSLNFGFRLLKRNASPTVKDVEDAILPYDADQAAEVSATMRAEGGLEAAMDQLEELYHQAIAEGATHEVDSRANELAVAAYLSNLAVETKKIRHWPHKYRQVEAQLHALEQHVERMKVERIAQEHLTQKIKELQQTLQTTQKSREAERDAAAEKERLHVELHDGYVRLEAYCKKLQRERETLQTQTQELKQALKSQRQAFKELQAGRSRSSGIKRWLPKRWR